MAKKSEQLRKLLPWICAATVFAVAAVFAIVQIDHKTTTKVETRWVEVRPAVTSGTFETFDLVVPQGYKLCSPPADFPASNGMVIPIDPSVACSSFDQNDPKHFPDSLGILDWADAAMKYDNVADVVRDACAGDDWDLAGKAMGGLDTTICTADLKDGRTLKMAIAYYGEPENGVEVRVAVEYHPENKEKAEALLQKTLAAMKFRPVRKE